MCFPFIGLSSHLVFISSLSNVYGVSIVASSHLVVGSHSLLTHTHTIHVLRCIHATKWTQLKLITIAWNGKPDAILSYAFHLWLQSTLLNRRIRLVRSFVRTIWMQTCTLCIRVLTCVQRRIAESKHTTPNGRNQIMSMLLLLLLFFLYLFRNFMRYVTHLPSIVVCVYEEHNTTRFPLTLCTHSEPINRWIMLSLFQ